MLRRYRKIEVDSRFIAAEDRGQYSGCGDDAAKLMSSNFFYLLLSPSIYKASGACESRTNNNVILRLESRSFWHSEEKKKGFLLFFHSLFVTLQATIDIIDEKNIDCL